MTEGERETDRQRERESGRDGREGETDDRGRERERRDKRETETDRVPAGVRWIATEREREINQGVCPIISQTSRTFTCELSLASHFQRAGYHQNRLVRSASARKFRRCFVRMTERRHHTSQPQKRVRTNRSL